MGACINGAVAAIPRREAMLADFPRREELASVQDHEYYPLSLYIELCDYLEARLGTYAFLRVGRKMAAAVVATAFPPTIRRVEDAVAEIDAAHRLFCRPVIGAFEIAKRDPGSITVRYTAPYNCMLQEGLFYEVALRFGAESATVTHSQCRRKGAEACLFEVKY